MKSVQFCAPLGLTLPCEVLQRRRMATRLNVSPEVASVLALHAFGEPRDTDLLVASTGEVRR